MADQGGDPACWVDRVCPECGQFIEDDERHACPTPADRDDEEADLKRLHEVIDGLLRDGTAVARRDGTIHELFPVAVTAAEGAALRDWVVREGAARTIEIGLGYGISTLFICEGLLLNTEPHARHVALDPNQRSRFADCGLQFLDEAGVSDLVEFYAENSLAALPRFMAEGRSFDFAFVDGNHRFDGVFVDLVCLGHLLRPGGVVFLDDYQLPGVAKAASFFTANLAWRIDELSRADDRHQWAVLRTAAEPSTRPFDYFVDF